MCAGDLLVTLVPLPIVMQLQMPKKQRVAVMVLLSLGFVVTAVGILRTYYIWGFEHNYDLSWASYPLYVCATIEVDLGIVSRGNFNKEPLNQPSSQLCLPQSWTNR